VKDFSQPSGVVQVQLDKVTNRLATPSCPQDYTVAFIAGTEPKETCDQAVGDHRGFFTKIFGIGAPSASVAAPPATTNGPVQSAAGNPPAQAAANGDPAPTPEETQKKKKKGFFSKIFGKGDSGDEQQNSGTSTTENGNNPSPK